MTLTPITASLLVDNGGAQPVFCVMAAFRQETEAVAALDAIGSAIPGAVEQRIIAAFLERSGDYLTNDATRRAALAQAWAEGAKSTRRTARNPYE